MENSKIDSNPNKKCDDLDKIQNLSKEIDICFPKVNDVSISVANFDQIFRYLNQIIDLLVKYKEDIFFLGLLELYEKKKTVIANLRKISELGESLKEKKRSGINYNFEILISDCIKSCQELTSSRTVKENPTVYKNIEELNFLFIEIRECEEIKVLANENILQNIEDLKHKEMSLNNEIERLYDFKCSKSEQMIK